MQKMELEFSIVKAVRGRDRSGEWVPGFFKFQTMFLGALDVRTSFDVTKLAVVARILTSMGVHGHVVAALLEEMMDVRFRMLRELRRRNFDTPGVLGRT